MKLHLFFTSCILIFLTGAFPAASQSIITTFSGGTIPGYGGDGGPATSAIMQLTVYCTADSAGNVYICDQGNHRIRKVNTAGIISTIAGTGTPGYSGDSGPATSAQINHPYGVAVDAAGNIYIVDNGNSVIRKVNPAGIITTISGVSGGGWGGDGGPATAAHFNFPGGIKIDASGNIFIADFGNNRIRKINTAGIINTIAGNGGSVYSGDGIHATAAALESPQDIAIDASGNVYISDQGHSRIRKVNTSGIISTIAGTGVSGFSGDGGPAAAAQISGPWGIVIDPAGNICFGDYMNFRVRQISTSGIITTVVGTGTGGSTGDGGAATAAQIYTMGICSDTSGRLYICTGQGVRRIEPDHKPFFIGGHFQYPRVCKNTFINLNTLLTVSDADNLQSETWSIVAPPTHGALIASYLTSSTGSPLVPSGLSYTPTVGYTGNDSFKVSISDCVNAADTTTLYITVDSFLASTPITGPGVVCPAHTILLSATTTGGTWTSSNTSIATISASGTVSGISPGPVNISYTLANSCGSTVSSTPIIVNPLSLCADDINTISPYTHETLTIYPNPIQNNQFALFISSPLNEEALIIITNLLGQTVKTFRANTNTNITVNTDFAKGIYLLSATTSTAIQYARISK